MRVPLSWLRDFAPIEVDPVELAETFDDLGLIVDAMERIGEGLGDVVVSRVVEIRPIPKADKIRQVLVDTGGGDQVEVVCGAWNFGEGDLVAFAPVGSVLPGGFEITQRRMRGVTSNGMLCSGRELALSDDHEGIMVLPPGARVEPGAALVDALGIEADVVYDLDVTPNRPDALSVAGVARDVAARLRVPFTMPAPVVRESGAAASTVASVAVDAPELCPRFTGRVLTGVVAGESPPWLVRRLTLAGMRPINSVVDASNYVMLELGQPTHPYDLDLLPGAGLLVRAARPAEVVVTLDGVERRVGGSASEPVADCLICDATGVPVGIGGIMGGASSEISEATTRVLLEAAYFAPMAIAWTSKRLGLRTEASVRFERGCDPEGIERAVARFCELVAGNGRAPDGGTSVAPGLLEAGTGSPPRRTIRVRTARVNAVLGTALADAQVRAYLEPIGFLAEEEGAGAHRVTIPSWRLDSEREIDVIEEVARHHGYSRITRTVPRAPQVGALTAYQRERRRLREVIAGTGATEAWTPSLLGPGDHERAGVAGPFVEVENPLAREESLLRRSMLPGMLRALAHNAGHRNPALRLFEVGRVFHPPLPGLALPDEHEQVAVALARPGDDAAAAKRVWDTLAGALRLDRVGPSAGPVPWLHPGRAARVVVAGTGEELGVVGEVDPQVVAAHELGGRVGWLELDLGQLVAAPRRSALARPVSRYPSSDIDLAFVVDDSVPASAVEAALAEAAGELLEGIRLFDVYRGGQAGAGRRSLAYRLRFCALDRTLTDQEVARLRARCIEAAETRLGARLRG
ncbi:MAG TPA: phenylalanine--tRNA ligase subunit beta [Acidimicrobiales bacterium]|nr:phenylalanine--tRNA ligase subunit beta [Acidimicrobiales bacterium]